MKRIIKSDLDKFYTKSSLSSYLISKLELENYQLAIDPCCGDGSFFFNLENINKIGFDIKPTAEGIDKQDFFEWDYSYLDLNRSKTIVISNPPFGKQGSLAMKFIKKSAEFSDTIAFILPISFSKYSLKNKIPEYYHLEFEEILPEDSFLLDGKDYSVRCVFQVWVKKNYKREKYIISEPNGFLYTKDKNKADISIRRVGVYAGKSFLDVNKSEQSHYFLIIENKSIINNLVNYLNDIIWDYNSVGPKSISKGELNNIINDFMIDKK